LRKYFKRRGFRALALLVGAGSLAIAAACTPVKPEAPPPDPSAGSCVVLSVIPGYNNPVGQGQPGATPASWDYGSVAVPGRTLSPSGGPAQYAATNAWSVTNNCTTDVTLTVTGVGAANTGAPGTVPVGGEDFQLTGENNCSLPSPGRVLPPGDDCTMFIAFTPQTTGVKTTNLTVVTDPATGEHVAALTGTGT
jgi:hypothetical protein